MNRIASRFALIGLAVAAAAFVAVALAAVSRPASAGDYGQPLEEPCYWCIRDAIYADTKLINHLEANPDVDEAVKGPAIVAGRADIHRLRALLGPLQQSGTEPCCYSRPRLYIR